jgi:hypothetical protein
MRKILLLIFFVICNFSFAEKNTAKEWHIYAERQNDSINVSVIANNTKFQLASLMQGLTINLPEVGSSFVFPSASMVRSKLKRHPNEVKAMMKRDSTGKEVKPDLQPLIQALSDTTGMCTDSLNKTHQIRSFEILLNKEDAILMYSVRLPLKLESDSLKIIISSEPGKLYDKKEFTGKRLSRESHQIKNGLGEAPMDKDIKNRTFSVEKKVRISADE